MNALIVGNGFDLAHGLPTTYWDCLNFLDVTSQCIEYARQAEYDASSPLEKILQTKSIKCRDSFYSISKELHPFIEQFFNAARTLTFKPNTHFVMLRACLYNNLWIKHFLHCQQEFKHQGKNWIDFEHEIAKIVRKAETMFNTSENVENESCEVSRQNFLLTEKDSSSHFFELYRYCDATLPKDKIYIEDLQELIVQMCTDLTMFDLAIEIYLRLCMNLIAPTKPNLLPDIVNIGKIDKVISFNYTDTFRRYDTEAEACFIHGKIRSDFSAERSSIVLGIDEYLDETEKDQKTDFLMFKKCYQRIYKATDYNYRQWFRHGDRGGRRCANSAGTDDHFDNNVYIFGHSLDVTDKDALSEILLADYTKTTIFYRSESQLASQVTNLIHIIGIDKLNELARSEPRAIFFQKQQTSKD